MKIKVKIIPGAQKAEVVGVLEDGTVKIRVQSPPEKGKANKELIGFLADRLNVTKGSISILRGATSRDKLVGLPEVENGIDRLME